MKVDQLLLGLAQTTRLVGQLAQTTGQVYGLLLELLHHNHAEHEEPDHVFTAADEDEDEQE